MENLKGMTIAILVEDGFEQVELSRPQRALVAVICHGPWTVIEAGAARGRRIASWPSLKTDLRNAGAEWVDEEVVVDGNLVSSRKPDDIPAFNREMVALFSRARAQARPAA